MSKPRNANRRTGMQASRKSPVCTKYTICVFRCTGAAADEQQALAIMQQQGHEGAGQVVGNGDAERAVLRVKQVSREGIYLHVSTRVRILIGGELV
eukprot:1158653-Pelagomonas_calceolata.AAC.3